MAGGFKNTQVAMLWILPLVVIGGLFVPWLGYIVIAMMAGFLVLSFFAGRHWCWNLCPRGAFLDIVLSQMTFNRRLPKIFSKMWFRWLVFVALMSFLIWRLIGTGGQWILIGGVFVTMCIITTIISILLGVSMKHRGWCMICPMGTLQQHIGKLGKQGRKGNSTTNGGSS